MKKIISEITVVTALFFLCTSLVSAHVSVKPSSVAVGSFQTFSIGVTIEKEIPTTGIRIVIPQGLQYVSPNVKPGWKIETKKSGTDFASTVTEIIWSNGSVPVGQRDDFIFSAKAPSTATTLHWKAYQTYQDGTVVSWDQDSSAPTHDQESENAGPASTTQIVDDLTPTTTAQMLPEGTTTKRFLLVLIISLISLFFSISAFTMNIMQKKHEPLSPTDAALKFLKNIFLTKTK